MDRGRTNRGLEDRLFEKEEQKHKSIVIQKSVTETGPAGDQHRNREVGLNE